MNTFEEEFPSLRDQQDSYWFDEQGRKGMMKFFSHTVQEYCLDKKRVLAVINETIPPLPFSTEAQHIREELLERLGIEEFVVSKPLPENCLYKQQVMDALEPLFEQWKTGERPTHNVIAQTVKNFQELGL